MAASPRCATISFSVAPGERVAVFGHNGAGKTTLLRCGLGDVAEMDGRVLYNGEPVVPGAVYRNARRGIGFVPQGHNVFRDLSVAQNLPSPGCCTIRAMSAKSTGYSRSWRNAGRSSPARCPAASSRCWRSAWR